MKGDLDELRIERGGTAMPYKIIPCIATAAQQIMRGMALNCGDGLCESEVQDLIAKNINPVIEQYAVREQRLRELGNIWMVEQVEYPPEGAVAAAAVRLCARELCTILNREQEKP